MRVLLVVAAGLALLAGRGGCAPAPGSAPEKKILMMHYMPWYETPAIRGRWGNHWKGHDSRHHPERTGAGGLPDIWSHFHPLIGLYDSTDPDALECHLLQMKLAGVDGVIADWYGTSAAADYPPIHKGARAMFEAAERFGMKFAACYEDRSIQWMVGQKKLEPNQVGDHLTQTLQWMQSEWFGRPQYLRVQGRPLLLNFGPIYVTDPATWSTALKTLSDRPLYYALHHLWKGVGADGGFAWVHEHVWAGGPDEKTVSQRLKDTYSRISPDPQKVIGSACPGFRDIYADSILQLPHRDGATMRESLSVAMQGPWPVIQLVTWNDYGEGTMIEPTHEFGYKFLEIVQEARRKESGAAFSFTAADLQLPARLYALRKKGGLTSGALNQVAVLLSAGTCQEARKALEMLEKP